MRWSAARKAFLLYVLSQKCRGQLAALGPRNHPQHQQATQKEASRDQVHPGVQAAISRFLDPSHEIKPASPPMELIGAIPAAAPPVRQEVVID